MRRVQFRSYKIGTSLPLEKPVTFFRMQRSSTWKESITLEAHHLESVLKKPCTTERVYLFEFGCICFVDCNEDDIQTFLEFIAGMMTDPIDYSMVARFAESNSIELEENSSFRPWPGCSRTFRYDQPAIAVMASILAKSAALNKIEADINENLDKSGEYIDYLRRGRLRINKKGLSVMISNFLKFEYESISSIRIFDRSVPDNDSMSGRELYDSLADYYELNDRFDVLQSKISSLRSTMKTYNSLSYRQSENRLYLFEVFLLGLFPAVSIIRMFFHF
jgi:required for meiotic nuclear division protein 1